LGILLKSYCEEFLQIVLKSSEELLRALRDYLEELFERVLPKRYSKESFRRILSESSFK